MDRLNKNFGEYGGQYVPEHLMNYLNDLEKNYLKIISDKSFKNRLYQLLKGYVGRPSPLYYAENMSKHLGCKIYLKREDLNHTGAHKINNTLGQGLLAKFIGKKMLIAETGAGQHGVATATIAALLNMKCKIFMGRIDADKQKINVDRMKILGAEVVIVERGGKVLKDAVDEALTYLSNHPDVFYLLGSIVGPHPYPTIVRDFQKIIGKEAREQILLAEGQLPDYLIACVGGGSNAMGLFHEFIDDNVKMIAIEPAGRGLTGNNHAATLTLGSPGIIHGFKCRLLQEDNGMPKEVYSIASGLDYPGVGPEISMLTDNGRIIAETVSDAQAIAAFHYLSRTEGIIPALESSHAIAYVIKNKDKFENDDIIIINLSGRGDKDVETIINLKQD